MYLILFYTMISILLMYVFNTWTKKDYELDSKLYLFSYILNLTLLVILIVEFKGNSNIWIVFLVMPALISISFIDFKYYLIPNRLNLYLLGISTLAMFLRNDYFTNYLVGGIIVCLVFSLLYFVTGGGVGMGDVKLSLPLGLLIGYGTLISFYFYTFFAAVVVAVILLILRKKGLSDRIAFGPYMALGYALTLLI